MMWLYPLLLCSLRHTHIFNMTVLFIFGYFSFKKVASCDCVCDYLSSRFEKSVFLKLHDGSYPPIFIVPYVLLPVMVYKFPFQTEAQYHSRAGTVWFVGQGSIQTLSPVRVASLSSFLWSTIDWTLPGNHRAGKIMEDIISCINSYHFNGQPHHYSKWLTVRLILFLVTWHSWHVSRLTLYLYLYDRRTKTKQGLSWVITK